MDDDINIEQIEAGHFRTPQFARLRHADPVLHLLTRSRHRHRAIRMPQEASIAVICGYLMATTDC